MINYKAVPPNNVKDTLINKDVRKSTSLASVTLLTPPFSAFSGAGTFKNNNGK